MEISLRGMTFIQFLAVGLTLLLFSKTFSDFKKKRITPRAFIVWTGLWLAMTIIAVIPQVTAPLVKVSGVDRGIDVVVYFSILFIFFILFKIITALGEINYKITKIIRHLALKDSEGEEGKPSSFPFANARGKNEDIN